MRVSGLLWSIVLALSIAAVAKPASACTCVRREIDDAFASSSHVILAKVVALADDEETDNDFRFLLFELEVESAWKGAASHKMFIRTGRGGGDCGRGKRLLNERWVFFARQQGSTLVTSICDNSEKATDAVIAKITKKFGSPKNPKK